MKAYLIKINLYRSCDDGEHEDLKITLLVYAESYEIALRKIKKKYDSWMLTEYTNLTIE